jgi:hypothetical protein
MRITGTVEKLARLGDFAYITGSDGWQYFAWKEQWSGPLKVGDRVEFDVKASPVGCIFDYAINVSVIQKEAA